MTQSLNQKLIRFTLTLSCLSLTSCANLTGIRGIDETDYTKIETMCEVFRPIYYSRLNDTEETIRAIIAHNKVYEEIC